MNRFSKNFKNADFGSKTAAFTPFLAYREFPQNNAYHQVKFQQKNLKKN